MERTVHRDYIIILIASFCFHICTMMVNPVITGYAESLGATAAIMGVVGGTMNLCALFCRPFIGNLTDRFSKSLFTGISLGLIILAGIIYSLSPSYQLVIVARMINGIGFAGCSISLSTWIADILPEDQIARGVGMYGTMNALAMSIGPTIGIQLYRNIGYKATFCVSVAAAVTAEILLSTIHNKGKAVPRTDKFGRKLKIVEPRVVTTAIVTMLFTIPYSATQSFLVRYTEVRGLNVAVGLFFTMYAVVLFFLRTGFQKRFDKITLGKALPVCALSSLASFVLLALMQNNVVMFLAAFFMAGGYGIMFTICQSSAISLARPGERGVANSTFYMGFDIGMTLGPVIGGILYGYVNIALFYPILILSVPLIFAVYFADSSLRGKA